jgi:hypothetical protein
VTTERITTTSFEANSSSLTPATTICLMPLLWWLLLLPLLLVINDSALSLHQLADDSVDADTDTAFFLLQNRELSDRAAERVLHLEILKAKPKMRSTSFQIEQQSGC